MRLVPLQDREVIKPSHDRSLFVNQPWPPYILAFDRHSRPSKGQPTSLSKFHADSSRNDRDINFVSRSTSPFKLNTVPDLPLRSSRELTYPDDARVPLCNPAYWVSNTGSEKTCAILKLAIRKIAEVYFLGIRLSGKRVFRPSDVQRFSKLKAVLIGCC